MELKAIAAQQVGGKAIDFSTTGFAIHHYDIVKAIPGNTILQHGVKKIAFQFEGMGQNRSFDSEKESDMAGPFGDPVKRILAEQFEMTIDSFGKVLTVRPGKSEVDKKEGQLVIALNLLSDITDLAYPPREGEASFFKILPDKVVNIGDTWTDSLRNSAGTIKTTYTLKELADSTFTIDFTSTSVTVTHATVMGRETSTTLHNTSIGRMIVEGATGIVREKRVTTESNGTTEAMGGTVPVTGKTTITIRVSPE